MHIPDGVLTSQVWAPLAVVSAAAVSISARAARRRLADASIPFVGVVGAFVFALQMLNFPLVAVGAAATGGISDHIVGAGLLAIAFGPSIAILSMSAIVLIQCAFGDGGIAALGANIFDMGVLSTLTAYFVYATMKKRLPTAGAVAGTFAGVMAGAAGAAIWVMLSQPYGEKFFLAMLATHAASGAVEAAVTVAVLRTLAAWGLSPGRAIGATNAATNA